MKALGEKVTLGTRLWLALHGFKRFDEDPDGLPLYVNLTKGSFLAPRTMEQLAVADARRAEEQKKAMADANARGEGPEQQGKLIQPGRMIPRRH
jgi:hypothetical protein